MAKLRKVAVMVAGVGRMLLHEVLGGGGHGGRL